MAHPPASTMPTFDLLGDTLTQVQIAAQELRLIADSAAEWDCPTEAADLRAIVAAFETGCAGLRAYLQQYGGA